MMQGDQEAKGPGRLARQGVRREEAAERRQGMGRLPLVWGSEIFEGE